MRLRSGSGDGAEQQREEQDHDQHQHQGVVRDRGDAVGGGWLEALVPGERVQRRFGVTVDPLREVLPLIGSKEGIFHLPLDRTTPDSDARSAPADVLSGDAVMTWGHALMLVLMALVTTFMTGPALDVINYFFPDRAMTEKGSSPTFRLNFEDRRATGWGW